MEGFQGGPLWLQQASVHIHPTPYNPHGPPPPSLSLVWQTGSLPSPASKWQPCGIPVGRVRVWPQGSSSLHTHPHGGSPLDQDRHTHTVQRQCRQAGSLRWRLQHLLHMEGHPPPPLPPTHPNYLVDELFFHLKPKGRIQMIIGFIYLFNVYRSFQCRLISHI